MIIGNGDIAKSIKHYNLDRPLVTFFASGVSNSKEDKEGEYEHEKDLLFKQPRELHLVYFSSLCIYYSQTRYAMHKLEMEHHVKGSFPSYTIVRLGNITWGNNKNTIINFFKWEHYNLRIPNLNDEYRFLINGEQFNYWIRNIPFGMKNEMNITGEMVHVKEIWRRVCDGKY